MKVTVQKIVLVLTVLLSSQNIFSEGNNPPPPTPPPGLPIDGGIVIMFFVALGLGYVLTRKYFIIKKSSL